MLAPGIIYLFTRGSLSSFLKVKLKAQDIFKVASFSLICLHGDASVPFRILGGVRFTDMILTKVHEE